MAFALRQRMLNFVQNLQYYMMFEVIEPNWQLFESNMDTVRPDLWQFLYRQMAWEWKCNWAENQLHLQPVTIAVTIAARDHCSHFLIVAMIFSQPVDPGLILS